MAVKISDRICMRYLVANCCASNVPFRCNFTVHYSTRRGDMAQSTGTISLDTSAQRILLRKSVQHPNRRRNQT